MKLLITAQLRIIILLILTPVIISAQGKQTNNPTFGNFTQSYLNDYSFTTTQNCSGLPTYFTIDNTEGIDSVFWNFNDAGNFGNDTSTLLNPSYTFSSTGTFYPELTVFSGNSQIIVMDSIFIYQNPAPNLGNDAMFCPDDPINLTLNAGPGEQYFWNGSGNSGQSTFQVTDAGTYTVRVMDHGCSGNDTINIGQYPEPIIDNTYLLVVSSNCGNSDGSITGIAINASYPYTIEWKDNSGNVVGTSLDLMNLPAGLYYLQVRYGENCLISFGQYIVSDIAAPFISHIEVFPDFCGLGTGAITVIPETGDPNEYWYSVNGGMDFMQNGGYFTGLHAGIYIVMIRNEAGCTNSTEPIFIPNENIPLALQIEVMPDYCGMNTGAITVILTGNSNEFWYSVNGGLDYVQNEGYFTGLTAGDYDVVIRNEVGCISVNHPALIAGIPCPVNVIGIPDLINTPLAEGMAVIIPPGGGPYTVDVNGNMQTVVNDTITGLFEGSHSITITNLYGFTLSVTLYIEGILGLDDTQYKGSFTLYQDGSSNIIYLDSGTATTTSGKAYAEIRNISGQLIDTFPIIKTRTEIIQKAFPKGIYIMTVFSEKGIWSVKFVK